VSNVNSRHVQYNPDQQSLTNQWCKSKALLGHQRSSSRGITQRQRWYGDSWIFSIRL